MTLDKVSERIAKKDVPQVWYQPKTEDDLQMVKSLLEFTMENLKRVNFKEEESIKQFRYDLIDAVFAQGAGNSTHLNADLAEHISNQFRARYTSKMA